MMKTDDKLLSNFFAAEKQEIADNGFSRRVMLQVPRKVSRLTQLWAFFVSLVALLLFFVFDGIQAVIGTLRDVCVSMIQNSATTIDPKSLIIVVAVLAFLGIRRIWAMA